jgi:leucyl-tRNA synthetase
MADFKKIQEKWQKKWQEAKIFQSEVDKRKKHYTAIVYPYMNGLLHLGHFYTYMFSDVLNRYKRMNDFNVLVKFAFHCTGTPIVAAAQKVKEKEKTQINALKMMGIPEKEIPKFSNPEYWTTYFPKETIKDVKNLGFSIDERYTFKTTQLNPPYDSFISWQLNKLKEKGYVKKGRHPVVWCPKDNLPVGDHDRAEGEGETPKDFIWGKFRLKNSDLIIMAGTTRPDAFYGQTHLWIDADGEYQVIQVKQEKWVVGKEAVSKIEQQYGQVKVIRDIDAKELMGKWARGPLVDYDVYIVPASFIDSKVGSGIVYSALEDPVDLFELKKIHSDMAILDEYHLDKEVVAKLKPISIIDIPGMSDNLGEDMGKELCIKSPNDKEKIEAAKAELNKRVFRKGIMKKNCGKCAGMPVPKAQEYLKKHLIEKGDAVMFYELSNKVVCRCLTECIIKMVSDQWFIEYNDPDWKKLAHKCLNKMKIYPGQVKEQFDYVLDWLHHWACTREYGLGTKLPWDKNWVIESLSDSTIQMAYGTISKYLQHSEDYGFKIDKLNDEFFDYIFLNKGKAEAVEKSTNIPKKLIETMKRDFEYWYPFDFRNSAKDLIQNHLAFCIFNHVALFPEKHWPKAYGLNGRIMVNNEKMSKSKGNFFTIRELYEKYGADAVRLTSAYAGEGIDDANYNMQFLEVAGKKIDHIYDFALENYNKGREERMAIDDWFESMINKCIRDMTKNMENVKFKSAVQIGFLDLQRYLRWYLNRTNNKPNKKLITKFIEIQTKLLSPMIPHICEEIWEKINKKSFVSKEPWPKSDDKKIDPKMEEQENLVQNTISDINELLKLVKIKPKKVTLFIAPKWKYDLFKKLSKEKTEDNKKFIQIAKDSCPPKNTPEALKIAQAAMKRNLKLNIIINDKQEHTTLEQAIEYLEKQFNLKFIVTPAEKSQDQKANNALPGKPAILLE